MVKKGPVTKIKEELLAKEAELDEIKTLMLRKAAEFDNARKRWERERNVLVRQASAEVLRDMVEVWDNFERALETAVEDKNTFESYKRGVELIFSQFQDALVRHGLNQYSCLGKEFNPALAEALGHFETDQAEPGKVVDELKKGFMLGDGVLRPAQVIVAKEIKKNQSQGDNPENEGG
ncbi:nucleotide exchange factor GrpE [candidate division WOR-3 bacterium]|nr:nucleotide exchange factor GrpE [candidate division WOR-3 bacterium]